MNSNDFISVIVIITVGLSLALPSTIIGGIRYLKKSYRIDEVAENYFLKLKQPIRFFLIGLSLSDFDNPFDIEAKPNLFHHLVFAVVGWSLLILIIFAQYIDILTHFTAWSLLSTLVSSLVVGKALVFIYRFLWNLRKLYKSLTTHI